MNLPYWKSLVLQRLGLPEKHAVVRLADVAEKGGWNLRTILPAISQTRKASLTTEECRADFEEHSEKWIANCAASRSCNDKKWGEKLYHELYADGVADLPEVLQSDARNVCLETSHGCVRTEKGELVEESAIVDVSLSHRTFLETPAKSIPSLPFFSLLASWPANYAHWLMDVLPRLAAVDFNLEGRLLLLPERGPDFQITSLLALGISEGCILRAPAKVARAKDIRLVRAATHTGVPRQDLMQRLRERFRKTTNPATDRKIYISRARSKRPLVNETEVRALLKERGFLIMENEGLTFADQVRLYSGAKVIVGAHGAGNYNLIFAEPGAQLLEIYNPLYWDGAAARISSLLGIEHWHVYGENLSEDYRTSIDIPRLARALDAMNNAKHTS